MIILCIDVPRRIKKLKDPELHNYPIDNTERELQKCSMKLKVKS